MLDRQWEREQIRKQRISDRRFHVGEIILLAAVAAAYAIYAGILSRSKSNPQPILVPYIQPVSRNADADAHACPSTNGESSSAAISMSDQT